MDYLAGQQNEAGQAIGYEEASRRWTSGNTKERIWVEEQADNFIRSQASHLLDLQNLDDWQEPSSKTIPDVKGQTEIELIADQNKEDITLVRANADATHKRSDSRYNSLTRSVSEIVASSSDSIEQQQTQIQTDVQGQGLSDANSGLIDRNERSKPEKQSNLSKFHFLTGETRLLNN